jgi:hypothetical protein
MERSRWKGSVDMNEWCAAAVNTKAAAFRAALMVGLQLLKYTSVLWPEVGVTACA